MADVDPLAFLKAEVANEDQMIRVTAMANLRYIAFALDKDPGKRCKRIVQELLPFLTEVMAKEGLGDEEMRYKIACNLRILVALMREGDPASLVELIPICSKLMEEEEPVVRDEAVAGFTEVLDSKPDLVDHGVKEFKRLGGHEWFTGRLSAVAFLPTVYKHVSSYSADEKTELLRAFTSFANDESPMVKRTVAAKLEDLVPLAKDLRDVLIPTYQSMAQEANQDYIRTVVVNATVALTTLLGDEECKRIALPNITQNIEDKSWRVRLRIAKAFPAICKNLSKELVTSYVLPAFASLFGDTEQEVRVAAATSITEAVQHLDAYQIESFLGPSLPQLAIDTCHLVRQALGKALGPLAQKLQKDVTNKLLMPLAHDLFKDESQETRLAVVEQVGVICEVLGTDAVATSPAAGPASSIIPALQVLVMDNHWRIRLTVVEQTVPLAKQYGVEVFQTKLEPMVWGGIDDSVFKVRQGSVIVVRNVSKIFGSNWTVDHLMAKSLDHYSASSSFVMRVTVLDLMHKLAENLSSELVMEHLVPVVLRALKDLVPNVRAQGLHVLMDWMRNSTSGLTPELLSRAVKGELTKLQGETDSDVVLNLHRVKQLIEAN